MGGALQGLAGGIHSKVVSERLERAIVFITLGTYSRAIPALQEEAAPPSMFVVWIQQALMG
jgi:hypothetical protein